MGTRSTIKFISRYKDKEVPLVNIYQQYDGYIDGIGYELAKWLKGKKICNGISPDYGDEYANGVGCLIAQFIRDFKEEIGGLYITSMEDKEEYNYEVIIEDNKSADNMDKVTQIIVTNWDNSKVIFNGTPSELLEFNEEEYWELRDKSLLER